MQKKLANSKNAMKLEFDGKLFGFPDEDTSQSGLPHISEVKRCRDKRCDMPVIFKLRNGKPHPYDVLIENGEVVEVRGSHFDTCEFADNFRKSKKPTTKPKVRIPINETALEMRIRQFNFPKWFHTQLYMVQEPNGTKVKSRDEIIVNAMYDFRRAKVKDKVIPKAKALSIIKNAIKEAKQDGIIVEADFGIFLKGKKLCKFDDSWRVIPYGTPT